MRKCTCSHLTCSVLYCLQAHTFFSLSSIILSRSTASASSGDDRHCHLHFLKSPMEFVSDEEGKVVTGVKFEDTMLEVR